MYLKQDSEELFALYQKLQSTDKQFLELLEDELDRKQLVVDILQTSSTWATLASTLKEQSAAFQRPSTDNLGSSWWSVQEISERENQKKIEENSLISLENNIKDQYLCPHLLTVLNLAGYSPFSSGLTDLNATTRESSNDV